jgi:hypothetical protein
VGVFIGTADAVTIEAEDVGVRAQPDRGDRCTTVVEDADQRVVFAIEWTDVRI